MAGAGGKLTKRGAYVAVQGQAPTMTFVWTESFFALDHSRPGRISVYSSAVDAIEATVLAERL